MGQRDMNESPRLQELYAKRVAAHGGGDAGAHATPEAILAVVQREGPEAERLATLEHVMSCATCHRDYEWLRSVDVAGDEFEERTGEHPIQARPWWQGRQLALAASLLMAVGAALAVRGVLRPGPDRVRGGSGDIALVAPGTRVPIATRRSPSPGAPCPACRATCSRSSGRTGRSPLPTRSRIRWRRWRRTDGCCPTPPTAGGSER